MPNPATSDDVVARWRPLSAEETTVANTRLGDAWVMLKRHATRREVDVEGAIVTDEELRDDVIRVLATAVLRVLMNPEGKVQEAGDDYSYTRGSSDTDGTLRFTDEELDDLFPGLAETGRAFTYDPLADYAARFE